MAHEPLGDVQARLALHSRGISSMTDTLLSRVENARTHEEIRDVMLAALDALFPFPRESGPDRRAWSRIYGWINCEAYESAVVQLCERVLPGHRWILYSATRSCRPIAIVCAEHECVTDGASSEGATVALALLAAVIRGVETNLAKETSS